MQRKKVLHNIIKECIIMQYSCNAAAVQRQKTLYSGSEVY